MAQNNLRIVYKNAVQTIGGSATANSMNDFKSQTDTGTSFTVVTSALTGPIAVVAVLAESSASSITMTVNTVNSVTDTTTSNFTQPTVGYGGLKYVVLYYTLGSSTTGFTVAFSSSVKLSKLIIGNYWTPKYNTGYGTNIGWDDLGSLERTQSGDQYRIPGPRSKNLNFSLEYIDDSDKFTLYDILRNVGKSTPLFVSLFPQDSDKSREQMYSIYGRMSEVSSITNQTYSFYSAPFQLTEF